MPDPRPAALPDDIAAAVRQAADALFQTLSPAMTTASPAPQITALWQMAKMLNAVSGGLDFGSVPQSDLPRAQWEEVAALASAIANDALTIAATGMSPEQASSLLLETDVDMYDGHTTAAYAGAIELTTPDWQETDRTLTVTVRGDQHRTLSVTTDRGPAPTPRPHTAATLLRTAHHLHQLGATLGELVPEPPEGEAHNA